MQFLRASVLASLLAGMTVLVGAPAANAAAWVTIGTPSITGDGRPGLELTVDEGVWDPIPDSFKYRWFAEGGAIAGATGRTFTPSKSHVGKALTARVTAVKAGYANQVTTSAEFVVKSLGVFSAGTPSIIGNARPGQVLTADEGAWDPVPDSFRYQWLANGAAITGATARTFTPSTSNVGAKLKVRVWAIKAGYTELRAVSAAVTVKPLLLPSAVLDLSRWKLTLPTGASGSPDEIKQPALASFTHPEYFRVNAADDGVVFRANAGGVTTSGSIYPRSELREMADSGGATRAAWSSATGTHSMTVVEAITATPTAKPEVVAAQIHDAADDVIMIRLKGNRLYVDADDSRVQFDLDTAYVLGTRFAIGITASSSGIRVTYDTAGKPQRVVDYPRVSTAADWYFKAGCYTLSNTSKGDAPDAYGEVVIYDLAVEHS